MKVSRRIVKRFICLAGGWAVRKRRTQPDFSPSSARRFDAVLPNSAHETESVERFGRRLPRVDSAPLKHPLMLQPIPRLETTHSANHPRRPTFLVDNFDTRNRVIPAHLPHLQNPPIPRGVQQFGKLRRCPIVPAGAGGASQGHVPFHTTTGFRCRPTGSASAARTSAGGASARQRHRPGRRPSSGRRRRFLSRIFYRTPSTAATSSPQNAATASAIGGLQTGYELNRRRRSTLAQPDDEGNSGTLLPPRRVARHPERGGCFPTRRRWGCLKREIRKPLGGRYTPLAPAVGQNRQFDSGRVSDASTFVTLAAASVGLACRP